MSDMDGSTVQLGVLRLAEASETERRHLGVEVVVSMSLPVGPSVMHRGCDA